METLTTADCVNLGKAGVGTNAHLSPGHGRLPSGVMPVAVPREVPWRPVQPSVSRVAPSLEAAALDIALAAIDAEALIITTSGAVVLANEAGMRLARRLPPGGIVTLARETYAGERTEYRITTLRTSAAESHYFLVRQRSARVAEDLLAERAREWNLTPRQTQALHCLVHGMCNKQIAASLSCAIRTVELHVSAVLRASGATSRAEAIALFWGDMLNPPYS